jgi:molecular chaperone GrpE
VVDNDNFDFPQGSEETAAGVDEAEVAALRAEVAQLKDQALRFAAEAENTRRRAEREVNEARAFAIQRFSRDLFEAADNLSRALQAARAANMAESPDPGVKGLVLGIEMTEKALQSAFERNGLKKVDPARGEKFDPHRHQAMMEQEAEDVPPGSVVAVMQTGYELFGRIVRPAMVVVTPKAPAQPPGDAAYGTSEAPAEGAAVDTKA